MIFKLDKDQVALMVIDMQRGFIESGAAMEVPPGREIIPNISTLINHCRGIGIPIIYTRFVYSSKVPNLIGELHDKHKAPIGCCMLGTPSAEIVEDLKPQQSDLVVDKHGYDAFRGTILDYSLRSLNIKQLIFTGVMTDICVLATVNSALHHEYQCWVVQDATATIWDQVQEVTIDLIARAYGKITTTKSLVEMIDSQ